MRIMTSNIWGAFFNNPTHLRNDNLYRVYEKYQPDVIGFQEAAAGWYDVDLFFKLGENYNLIGTECCNNQNSTPMAIKKEYEVIAKGHEQLCDTPDKSKSITWAVVQKDGKTYAFCNTHFWWMHGNEADEVKKANNALMMTLEEHCALREQNAAQLCALMRYLQDRFNCPVVALGDLNATVEESVFTVFAKNGVTKLYDLAKEKDTVCSVHGNPQQGEDGLYHGEKATADSIAQLRKALCLPEDAESDGAMSSIDHILGLGNAFCVAQYRIVEDQSALDATDHSPVYVDFGM